MLKKTSKILWFSAFFILITIGSGIIFSYAQEDDLEKRIKNLQDKINLINRELEQSKKKLEQMSRKERNVRQEYTQNEKKIETLNGILLSLRTEENQLKKELENTQKKIAETNLTLDQKIQQYSEHIRSMYMRRRTSQLEIVFSGVPVSARLRAIKMMNIITQDDVKVLNEIQTAKEQMETHLRRRQMELDATLELSTTRKREQLNLSRTQRQRENLLAEIKKNEQYEKQRQKNYLAARVQATDEVNKLIAEFERKRPPTPESLKGYNFASWKGKLPWPVSGTVVANFGILIDPITKTRINNNGIEIETSPGHRVESISAGVVKWVKNMPYYGINILVYNPENYYTIYGHLEDVSVNVGDILKPGWTIGTAGTTGLVDVKKPRLLLEIRKGATAVNPLEWLQKKGGSATSR